jgi:hypothetical protein
MIQGYFGDGGQLFFEDVLMVILICCEISCVKRERTTETQRTQREELFLINW